MLELRDKLDGLALPGDVATPGADLIRQTIADAYGFPVENLTNNVPLGRVGVPQDIAEAVLFLVSAAWRAGFWQRSALESVLGGRFGLWAWGAPGARAI